MRSVKLVGVVESRTSTECPSLATVTHVVVSVWLLLRQARDVSRADSVIEPPVW